MPRTRTCSQRWNGRREEPFDARVVGRLATHSRHLLRAHLGVERKKSLRRAEDLIMDAFESKKTVKQKAFDEAVFDSAESRRPSPSVVIEVDSFLNDQLQLAGQDGVEDLRGPAASSAGCARQSRSRGADGRNAPACWWRAGRGSQRRPGRDRDDELLEPGGMDRRGHPRRTGDPFVCRQLLREEVEERAEKQRVQARAKAIGQARSAVSSQFDLWETQQLEAFVERAWGLASLPLRNLILLAYAGRQGISEIETLGALARRPGSRDPARTSA